MIELLIVHDADGRLRTRADRDATTLSQLAALGIVAGGLTRRCSCGSVDHGALSPSGGARIGISRSRSSDWHAFATSTVDTSLGVDLEPLSRRGKALRAAPRFICPSDVAPGADAHAALRMFIRKEAILKARGTGLHLDPRLQPTSAVATRAEWRQTSDGWWLHEREVRGLLVCVATATPQSVELVVEAGGERAHPALRSAVCARDQ